MEREFRSDAWVMPQGSDLGRRGAQGDILTWSYGISN